MPKVWEGGRKLSLETSSTAIMRRSASNIGAAEPVMKRLAFRKCSSCSMCTACSQASAVPMALVGAALDPAGTCQKSPGLGGLDKAFGAPRLEHLALIVSQQDQAIGVTQDIFVKGQDLLMGGLYQRAVLLQQVRDLTTGQLTEGGARLVIQPELAAACPGLFDDDVVSDRSAYQGHARDSCECFLVFVLRLA